MSSRFRIILGMMLIGIFGFFALSRWAINELRPHYLKSMEESLVDQATLLSSLVSSSLDSSEIETTLLEDAVHHALKRRFSAQIYDVTKESMNTRVYVTDMNGVVIFDSYGKNVGKDYSQWNDVYNTLQGKYGSRSSRDIESDDNSSVLYVASPILYSDSIIGSLTVGKPAKSVNLFIKNARDNLIIAVILTGMLLFLFALLFTHWVTVPIRKITRYAHTLSKTPNNPPLNPSEFGTGKHNEFRILAEALEEMRESLEGKRYVEQYVQTLTHEIKSPLSTIKGSVELIDNDMPEDKRERFLENIKGETERITAIIDRLLQLSSLEHTRKLQQTETVSLNDLLNHISQTFSARCATKNIAFAVHAETPVTVEGNAVLLEQIVQNLLSNAFDFTPENGTIQVNLTTQENRVLLSIQDSGEGVPEYALTRIFERFYSLARPHSGRKSSGLGLPFVKEAVELHKGTISVANREEGGTQATISLPLTQH